MIDAAIVLIDGEGDFSSQGLLDFGRSPNSEYCKCYQIPQKGPPDQLLQPTVKVLQLRPPFPLLVYFQLSLTESFTLWPEQLLSG